MKQAKLKYIKASAVGVLGGLFILGLTPTSAWGNFWHWPFGQIHTSHVVQGASIASDPLSEYETHEQKITPSIQTNQNSKRVVVLMYHHVQNLSVIERHQDGLLSDLSVSPSDFESQVKYLHDLGYQSITVSSLYNSIVIGTPLPIKPIVFTFDDGYSDVFAYAIPILKKYGFTGSLAIATELLGRPTYATWDDVIKADRNGVEILSHTENHLDLTNAIYSADDLIREIKGSKIVLEERLGHSVDFFIYPYGHFNQKVTDLVVAAGYKMAFTTAYGVWMNPKDMHFEPRVRVHGVDGLAKLKKVLPN